jgi:hypothetical protein
MQCLSDRASGPRAVVTVAEACCGINSQDFRESFSSFWARADKFRDSDLLSQLKPRGGLARTWTVRGTMHTFPTKDYFVYVFGSGRKRILSAYESWAKKLRMPPLDFRVESLYQPLLDNIKGKPVTSAYIKGHMIERLAKLGLKSRTRLRRGWSSKATYGPAWTGITEMSYLGLLVSAGRRGAETLWMRTSDWLGSGRKVPDPEDCTTELVRGYIQRYGPVTRSDIAFWNNRLMAYEVNESIQALSTDLVKERFEGSKETFYSFGGESGGFAEPDEAVILPEFDSLMMGYKDRSRFLSPKTLGSVSRPGGMISRTVLVDGFVAATWGKKRENDGMSVTVEPFRNFNARERRSIEQRFSEYGDYLGTAIGVEFMRPSST